MNLRGRFGDTTGRPYIEGRLAFPRFKIGGDVSFLVDTGADQTSVMPIDAFRLGLDYSKLSERQQTLGAGGAATPFVERAIAVFATPDRKLFIYDLSVLVYPDEPESEKVPSLLGRDIISRWRILWDPTNGTLEADVISADFENDPPS